MTCMLLVDVAEWVLNDSAIKDGVAKSEYNYNMNIVYATCWE